MESGLTGEGGRKQIVVELTGKLARGYFRREDRQCVPELLDDSFTWFGADGQEGMDSGPAFGDAQLEYRVLDESYHAVELAPEVYLCTGRVRLTREPEEMVQRVTAVFRFEGERARCCHIHLSVPCGREMRGMEEQLAAQKRRIEAQNRLLQQISFKDSLTGMFNRNKFSQDLREGRWEGKPQLGIAYFDLNGLKSVNDRLGHSAGDNLLYRTAAHILRVFDQQAYRIGGDEFVVVDDQRDEARFREAVDSVCKSMAQNGISCAVGLSWQSPSENVEEQFNQADHLMYREKRRFYSIQGNDRRKR